MKAEVDDATLIELATRLERSNATRRGPGRGPNEAVELGVTPADREARAVAARVPKASSSDHAAAYLGVGAVVLGLICLIILRDLLL